MRPPGRPGGGSRTFWVNAINDQGAMVGMGEFGDHDFGTFLYRNGAFEHLANLTDPRELNDRGDVVGVLTGTGGAALYAIDANSGWLLEAAYDTNDHGHIVGYGVRDGVRRGFVLVPCRSPTASSPER
jgi:hypothetical protein